VKTKCRIRIEELGRKKKQRENRHRGDAHGNLPDVAKGAVRKKQGLDGGDVAGDEVHKTQSRCFQIRFGTGKIMGRPHRIREVWWPVENCHKAATAFRSTSPQAIGKATVKGEKV